MGALPASPALRAFHRYKGNLMASGIHIKKSHRGALRRQLGIPAGEPIPTGTLQREAKSKSSTTRKRAQFALNARTWAHA